jgi:RimJ/RimL family protein N-acetyltransferase
MGNISEKSQTTKNGNSVIIRTVRESDAEAYLTLGRSIMSEDIYSLTQADELNLTVEQEREWLKSNIEDDSHLIIVAESNGKIIGQLDFSNGHRKRNAHTGEFGMGVHKDFRGQGIGSLLIGALVDWARGNAAIEKINLCVHQTNYRAIATYKKIGFQVEGLRTKDLKYPNGVYVDTVLMGLRL